jgi:hypothetical protein
MIEEFLKDNAIVPVDFETTAVLVEALRQATEKLKDQERNFCQRCGKRLGGIDSIHTCTPPQNTWAGSGNLEDSNAYLNPQEAQPEQTEPKTGSWIRAKEINEMVRDLDVAMNGDGAAPQAKLIDLMPQLIQKLTLEPLLELKVWSKDGAFIAEIRARGEA